VLLPVSTRARAGESRGERRGVPIDVRRSSSGRPRSATPTTKRSARRPSDPTLAAAGVSRQAPTCDRRPMFGRRRRRRTCRETRRYVPIASRAHRRDRKSWDFRRPQPPGHPSAVLARVKEQLGVLRARRVDPSSSIRSISLQLSPRTTGASTNRSTDLSPRLAARCILLQRGLALVAGGFS
jgi:hypothetical protein